MELNISNAEMAAMRVIWSMGQARADEVYQQIGEDRGWTAATVRTLLGRLVTKGMLKTERQGRAYVYQPSVSSEQVISSLAQEMLDKICATKQPILLESLIQKCQLTQENLAHLSAQIAEKKPVDEVQCTCLTSFGVCTCMDHEHEKSCQLKG